MAFRAGAEADYRYAHALYNMAERIGDRHPRVVVQLEKAADALLLALYDRADEDDKPATPDRQDVTKQRLARRVSATFRVPEYRPSLRPPRS